MENKDTILPSQIEKVVVEDSGHEWTVTFLSPGVRTMTAVTAGGCTNRKHRCAEELTW